MNFIFRIFLTISALSLFVSLFLINIEYILIASFSDNVNYIIYMAMPFILSYFSILMIRRLGNANLAGTQFIEPLNNALLSNYITLLFLFLIIVDWTMFFYCFTLIVLFTFHSRTTYFNPIFLVFGYNFYYVHLANKSKVLLITKQIIKRPENIPTEKEYKRINNYTFID